MAGSELYGSGTVPKKGDTRRMLMVKEVIATNAGGGGGGGGGIPIGNPGSFKSGTVSLGNNVSSGTVTGLALPGSPNSYNLTVVAPANGLTLAATLLTTGITSDGFQFTLSGATDSASYKLVWTANF